ncbi:nucleoside-diphosphate sugar epimerase/dehydratase [Herbaspirillum sp. RTI4]|uniref:polysaccharide biosynthesis protein n=1 Tax=Herbaspirillum sp. RTI4 TaxID=3048640 RepID=UPI002AB373D2|nr:nucleoside-diphosphate sugar epimerase/dehydratase [Herbaspirillum sp. RTI4]MDY7577629.1 nucleoside-diphosphate sugar epimerase/dehydratase [Herbaspirillum sp. RTI4]MEA9982205.1 nucleoside-diphosphate sugar epimerase/dehydratase [Herbaspirillum sp. RTI4]
MQNRIKMYSRYIKQCTVVVMDILMSLMATWAAFSLRLDTLHWPESYQWHVYQLCLFLAVPIFVRLGLYRAVFRYTGMAAMLTIVKAVAIYGVILFGLLMWFALPGVPRSVGLLQPLLFLILVGGSRIAARFWLSRSGLDRNNRNHRQRTRLLIYGAGSAGVQIAEALTKRNNVILIGFLDDDPRLHGKTINDQRVYSPHSVAKIIALNAVTDVLLALPSINRSRRREILADIKKHHVHIRSLPDLNDLAQGIVTVSDIRELDIADLLAREPVPPNPALISRNITDKVVLITGAGGSIGSELCRQILAARPSKMLLLDHNEFSLYEIHKDLLARIAELSSATELVPLLGSVRNYRRLSEICQTWLPRTVYHAAAYKHVPLVEHNPAEGMRNNVLGTYNLARAALEAGVSDYVLISTDKAVRPTNVMGASKRLAEMILQALSVTDMPVFDIDDSVTAMVKNKTRFSMVRFGNVLGSSGSVVPLFRQQIRDGGPITLTDPEVTRYFMTIPEAAQLVVQAAAMAEGGDVFVLDMGEPVKIIDLASRMIELSGLTVRNSDNPEGDIAITVSGLRPGEKLYEELLIGENPQPTLHPRIMKAHEDYVVWDVLKKELRLLIAATEKNDVDAIRTILGKLVSGYEPQSGVVDLVSLEVNRSEVMSQ